MNLFSPESPGALSHISTCSLWCQSPSLHILQFSATKNQSWAAGSAPSRDTGRDRSRQVCPAGTGAGRCVLQGQGQEGVSCRDTGEGQKCTWSRKVCPAGQVPFLAGCSWSCPLRTRELQTKLGHHLQSAEETGFAFCSSSFLFESSQVGVHSVYAPAQPND